METDTSIIFFNIHALKPGGPPKFVRMVGVYRVERYYGNSCKVGIIMTPGNFGTGFATDAIVEYAFEVQKFRRVAFHTALDNTIVRKWIERMGGVFEGIERDYWSDGKGGHTDDCLYSVLHRESPKRGWSIHWSVKKNHGDCKNPGDLVELNQCALLVRPSSFVIKKSWEWRSHQIRL
ncbi:hypothetical protein DFH07DRAFT_1018402 [Mycena maculata]|uniref:N-acetyltransferase domain-containing protein n=1 Tax=Mycena maculata TaxID=230809 RepID=A0AAD7JF93_9AGAR|nr:hypothetical protein DFH07DRAFT_1018402 [Mycena maculata]